MQITNSGTNGTVEYFGHYTHTVRFSSFEDVERYLPAILKMLGEGVEELTPTRDDGGDCYCVDLVTDARLDEAQVAALANAEGALSSSCNQDMQETGVASF